MVLRSGRKAENAIASKSKRYADDEMVESASGTGKKTPQKKDKEGSYSGKQKRKGGAKSPKGNLKGKKKDEDEDED